MFPDKIALACVTCTFLASDQFEYIKKYITVFYILSTNMTQNFFVVIQIILTVLIQFVYKSIKPNFFVIF